MANATNAQLRYLTTLAIRWGKVPTEAQLKAMTRQKVQENIAWFNTRLAKANRNLPVAEHQALVLRLLNDGTECRTGGDADRRITQWARQADSAAVWKIACAVRFMMDPAMPSHYQDKEPVRRDDDHFHYDGTVAESLPATAPGHIRRCLNGPSAERTATEDQISTLRYAGKVAGKPVLNPELLSYAEAGAQLRRLAAQMEGKVPVEHRHFLSLRTKTQAQMAKTRFGAKWCDVKKSYYVDRRFANWAAMPEHWLGIAVGDLYDDAILGR